MTGRPFRVKLITMLFIIVFINGMQRFISAIHNFAFLEKLLPFSPYYLVTSGFLCATIALLVILQLWFNQPYRRIITSIATLFIALGYWAERLTFYKNSVAQANFYFSIASTLLILIFVFAGLYFPLSAHIDPSRREHHYE